MTDHRGLIWIGDASDSRIIAMKALLLRALEDQSKNLINYYDFLLVAKKLNFRFEESPHLMELRKYFFTHKNQLLNKRLASLLCVQEGSLAQINNERFPQKVIVRFRVGEEIQAIKQVTNQDEDAQDDQAEPSLLPYSRRAHLQSEEDEVRPEESQQYRQKLTIILSIKVSEMVKKIKILKEGTIQYDGQDQHKTNIISIFNGLSQQDSIQYQIFRKGVVQLLRQLETQFLRDRLTMSEDDIRAVFTILQNTEGKVGAKQLEILSQETEIARRITKFYEARINKRMVKNTLFKLGKGSNSIQIYQVKNASVLEFKAIEEGLLDTQRPRDKRRFKNPHFGPIKGDGLRHSPSRQIVSALDYYGKQNKSSLGTYKREQPSLDKQRQKIERIIRSSKQQKKKQGNDTIANKLRKLFIHKVILPREKLLEQQKMKYLGNKSQSSQVIVRLN